MIKLGAVRILVDEEELAGAFDAARAATLPVIQAVYVGTAMLAIGRHALRTVGRRVRRR